MSRWLEFTLTVSPCLGCKVCPQSALGATYASDKKMSLSNFINIVEALPYKMEVHFSGFSEPFLHSQASTMMWYVQQNGNPVSLYTTLMGLDGADIRPLKLVNFHYVKLHLPDTRHLKIPSKTWLRQFDLWLQTGHKFDAMAMGPVKPEIEAALPGVKIEYPEMLSRAGNAWRVDGRLQGRIACAMDRWHNNVVLPNGDVVLCCMDWGLTMPIGNLLQEPYSTIYERAEALKRNDNPPQDSICRTCEWARSD